MSTAQLGPMSLGELLDRTVTLYRKYFWLLVGIMVFPEVFAATAQVLYSVYLRNRFGVIGFPHPTASPAPWSPSPAVFELFVAIYLLFIVDTLIHSIALAAATFAVSGVYLEGASGIQRAYRSLKSRVLSLIGMWFLAGLIALGVYALVFIVAFLIGGAASVLAMRSHAGLAGGIVIGVVMVGTVLVAFAVATILLFRLAVSIPALMLEPLGPLAALKRSFALTKGFVGRIFLTVVLMILIQLIIGFALQVPVYIAGALMGFPLAALPVGLAVPAALAGALGYAISGPLLAIALVLLYYDARVRKEGFDLQLMLGREGVA